MSRTRRTRRTRNILATAGFILFLILGLSRLRLDTDVLALLPADLPTVRALVLQQHHFATAAELLITLQADDPDLVEESARSLAESIRATSGLARWTVWTAPWEERPDLAAELVAATWLNGPSADVEALATRLEPASLRQHLESVRQQLASSLSPAEVARSGYDPLGLLQPPGASSLDPNAGPRFASDDGRFRLILVTPPSESRGYQDAIRWLADIRATVERWQAGASERAALRIRFTGGPAFTAEIAKGMDRDMRGSVIGTGVVIAALFGWAHRRLRPLLALLAMLGIILLATLAAGGLLLGRLNAISLGFAAILLGLAVDYGLVLYQESLAHPESSPAEVRHQAGPGILWAALTTAAAFGTLAFGGLPGLTQLGVLVACGTLLAAALMLGLFLSPRLLGKPPGPTGPPRTRVPTPAPARSGILPTVLIPAALTLLLGAAIPLLLLRGLPGVDPSAAPLRPRNSEAHAALQEMQRLLGNDAQDPWWIVAHGPDEATVARQLQAAETILAPDPAPSSNKAITSHQLPTPLWPDPERQHQNRPALARIAGDSSRLRNALLEAGFTDQAFGAARVVLAAWERAGGGTGPFWPTNDVSAWTLAQVTARPASAPAPAPATATATATGTATLPVPVPVPVPASGPAPVPDPSPDNPAFLALGFAHPTPGADASEVRNRLRAAGLLVGGWDSLGSELLGRVEGRLPWLGGAMAVVWLGALGLTFRSLRDTALAAGTLAAGVILLLASMTVLGWRWNLMNLMALPLLIGVGTDYAIHLLLSLRRHHGDLTAVRRGTGRAVLLCAATTITGFGSLAFSGNDGLASLGAVCAAGLTCVYLASAHLLPAGWRLAHPAPDAAQKPSALYGAHAWRAATALARILPAPWLARAASALALAYAALHPARRRVVANNLLPVLRHNPDAARRTAWRTFAAFGRKLADLWTYEAGRPIDALFTGFTGWEHLEAARATGRGVLLLTPHLGNWEFGAPLLASRGIRLLVITLAEPGDGLTELRQAARARWGIETLVIGQDPFAFVTIIQRLQDGAVVALLVDRPPPPTAVVVSLFGQPFGASVAGAELARASNCVLLPTAIVRTPQGYDAHVLPPIPYDRRTLGNRASRHELTRDILRAFEPWLRKHPEQWFHFVPVWPASS